MTQSLYFDGMPQSESYRQGKAFFLDADYQTAEIYFRKASCSVSKMDAFYPRYESYTGLCMVLLGDPNGLAICRVAALNSSDAEVYANLALAEFHSHFRGRAFEAILKGQRLNPKHPRLDEILSRFDKRKRPTLRYLSRNHCLNRWLSRRTLNPTRTASNQASF